MTTQEWLTKVKENEAVLKSLIAGYHPSMHAPRKAMPITAARAEQACENIRKSIQAKEPGDPITRFDNALASGDFIELNSLLNSAWFGVSESTSCWSIEGFREAVDLMDDLPEEMYEKNPEEETFCTCPNDHTDGTAICQQCHLPVGEQST